MAENETTENKRKRLIFRSNHRGTKEMDLLLGTFAEEHVPNFSAEELSLYDELLKENDPNLYNWMTGKEDAPEHVQSHIFERLKAHKFA